MANNNDKFISRENAKTLWGYMIDLLTGKQNKLTFDDTPTQSSDNPVKSGGIFTALAGKGTYSKPQNGIPKTDLENAVQTSLGLADSALQSETDPTVPSWAKQTNKPSYTQDEVGDGTTYKRVSSTEKDTWNAKGTYSKPSGGIPKSDLASAVQTSLGKADTAVQNSSLVQLVDDGAKNLLSVLNYGGLSDTGISVSDIDGTAFHITGSTSIGDAYYVLGYYALPDNTTYTASISTTGTGSCTIKVYGHRRDNNNWTQLLESYTNQDFTTDNTTYYEYMVRAQFKSGSSITYNADAYPMICTKSQFGISPEYEPYALGNQYLTPALIQQVDEGAKNLLKYDLASLKAINTEGTWNDNQYTINGVTFTVNSDLSIKANGTSNSSNHSRLRLMNFTAQSGLYISGSPSDSSVTAGFFIYFWGGNTYSYSNGCEFDSSDFGTTSYITVAVIQNKTASNKVFYPMICTLADWNVSHKYVPYRPNWDLVQYMLPVSRHANCTISNVNTYTIVEGLLADIPRGQTMQIVATAWRNASHVPQGIQILTDTTTTGLDEGDMIAYNESPKGLDLGLSASGVIKNVGTTTLKLIIRVKYDTVGTYPVTAVTTMIP